MHDTSIWPFKVTPADSTIPSHYEILQCFKMRFDSTLVLLWNLIVHETGLAAAENPGCVAEM